MIRSKTLRKIQILKTNNKNTNKYLVILKLIEQLKITLFSVR